MKCLCSFVWATGNFGLFIEKLRHEMKCNDVHPHTSMLLTKQPGGSVLRGKLNRGLRYLAVYIIRIFIIETLPLTLSSSCYRLSILSLTKLLLIHEKIHCQKKKMCDLIFSFCPILFSSSRHYRSSRAGLLI